MSDSNLIMSLARVMIAVAWVDGTLDTNERNALKDLLFRLPDLSGQEWTTLEMYLEAPVGSAERERLIAELQANIRTNEDKALVHRALSEVAAADGVVSADEQQVLDEISNALDAVGTGLLGRLGGLMKSSVSRRNTALDNAPNREKHFEDYITNKVYYGVQRQVEEGRNAMPITEDKLRLLCLAGGLMARVAHADGHVDPTECEAMAKHLVNHWNLSETDARFVVDVAVEEISADLDYYRLTRDFFAATTREQRQAYLTILFQIAAADGVVDHTEVEEIRSISTSLKLEHADFIHAKLSVS
ncbi:MAG: hypothetical protein CMH54_12970 [Myxococcales bacterium]|nr:hypothetical protein [Myxococcales bacterium]